MNEKQEIFDKVSRAILAQNHRCMGPQDHASAGESCIFFGRNSDRCAIGHIIPDDLAKLVKESYNDASLLMLRDTLASMGHEFATTIKNNYHFLKKLQIIHDTEPVSEWRHQLILCANEYGLETTSLGVSV